MAKTEEMDVLAVGTPDELRAEIVRLRDAFARLSSLKTMRPMMTDAAARDMHALALGQATPSPDLAAAPGGEQPGFVYLECPDCQFSAVLTEARAHPWQCCPMCAEDNGRDVRMRERLATAADKAEGQDDRPSPAAETAPEAGLVEALKAARSFIRAAVLGGSQRYGAIINQIDAALSVPAQAESGLAEGCCSAVIPCNHQKASPYTICDTCHIGELEAAGQSVVARQIAEMKRANAAEARCRELEDEVARANRELRNIEAGLERAEARANRNG